MGISRTHACLILFFLLSLVGPKSYAQVSIAVNQPGLGEMEVCVDSANFSFLIGPFSTNLTNVEIHIELPSGIYVDQNSLTNLPSADVAVNLGSYTGQTLTFIGSNINGGESYDFSIDLFAGCDALPDFLSGQAFRNTIEVSENGTLYEQFISPLYNPAIDYAQLSMSAGTTPTGVVGQTVMREHSIFSTGSGCIKSLGWYDAHGSEVSIDSVYFQGQKLNTWTNGDTIFYDFSGIDFQSIGDGDGEFCQSDGAIVLTEYIKILGCADKNSFLNVGWGCNGMFCSDFNLNTDVIVQNLQPSLEFISRPDTLSGCFYNQANRKELIIKNVGTGSVSNVEVEIKKNYYAGQIPESQYDGLDSNSVQIRFNEGAFQSISPRNVEANIYGNACSLPLAYRFYVDIDFLTPGDSITLAFDMINCVPDDCSATEIRQGSWGYNCRYELPCIGSTNVIANQIGGYSGILEHQISNFDPPTLVSGKSVTFTTTMERSEINFPAGGAFLIRYTLPTCGATFSGNAEDFRWTNIGGDLDWPQYDFSSSATQAEAKFDLDSIPQDFSVNGSEIKLDLLGDCSCPSTDSIQFLEKEIIYLPTPNCSPQVEIPLFCDTVSIIVDPCLVTTCNGMQIVDFNFQRSNLDIPDSDLNRMPEIGGSFSPDIRTNRARLGDTLRTQLTGYVNGAGTFIYGYADITVAFAQYLSPLSGSLRMFDLSTGTNSLCANVLPTRVGASDVFRVDYSPLVVATGCPSFGTLNLETGDSIFLDLSFVVSSVHPSDLEVGAIFPVEMYMSNVPNPAEADKFTCQGTKFSELMQLVPMVDTSFVTQISAQSCQQTQARTYINMFTGGSYTDMFPFEYRFWSFPDSLLVTPPANYNYVSANILLRFTPYIAVMNVAPVDPNANPLVFDLKALVDNGSLMYPDDGYELQFFTTWLPECDAVSNQQVNVPVEGRFRWASGLSAYDVPKNYLPTIRHNTPNISLNNQSATTQDGLKKEVSWIMQVSNTSINSNSPYTWMAFYSPSGEVQVVDLLDNNGNPISQNNGIYELGLINTSASKEYTINAEYDQCNMDTLIVYTGWECAGYPDSLAVACQTDSFYLRIDPKPADGQISLNTTVSDTVALFEPISYDLAIRSTQIANLDELVLDIFHANSGLDFIPGSAELEYPIGSGYRSVADPQPIAGGYRFTMADYDSTLAADGLAGLASSTNPFRQFNIRFDLAPNCNFSSGETFLVKLDAFMPCGDPLNIQRIMEPIFIDGGLAPYQTQILAQLNQVYACDNYDVRVSLIPTDTIGSTDSVEIFIPHGFSYDSSRQSYLHNPLPDSFPVIEGDVQGNWYSWALDSGVVGGDSLVFLFGIKQNTGAQCPSGTQVPFHIRTTYQYPGNCQTGSGNFFGTTGIDTFDLDILDNFVPKIGLDYTGANPRSVSQDSQQWVLDLSHLSGNYPAAFPWIRFISQSGNSYPLGLTDQGNNTTLPWSNGFWQLDSLGIGETLQIALDASVSFCGPDTLWVLYGYGCNGYPTDSLSIPCSYDSLSLVVNPTFPYIDLSAQILQEPTCYRGNDGHVLLTASGGPSPYQYALDTLIFGASPSFNTLEAGNHRFYAQDSIGCIDSVDVLIEQPDPLVLSVDSILNITCNGDSTGHIQVSATGGVGPYSFTLNQGTYGANTTFSQLPAGVYWVKIRDSRNCEDSTKVSLLQAAPILSLMQVDSTISCFGINNGAISVSSSGGNGNLTYTWQGLSSTDASLQNLGPGKFIVTLSDEDGCSTTDSLTLTGPDEMASTLVETDMLTCHNSTDAAVEALLMGGSGGYSYTWSAGTANNSQVSDLGSGMLYLEVSDANSCIHQDSIEILAPPVLDWSISGSPVSCFGGDDGSISGFAIGGEAPYNYRWDNTFSLTGPNLTNRIAGSHLFTVTDNRGCQDTISYQITQPPLLTLVLDGLDETCSNSNGSIWVEPSGGTAPYQFIWNNDPALNGDTLSNISQGSYSITVTDANNCQANGSYAITNQVAPIINLVSSKDVSCYGGADGTASVQVNGNRTYTYTWLHSGEQTPSVSGLAAGTYTVLADDGTCEGRLDVMISAPTELIADIDSRISPSCSGNTNGSLFISASGGTAPYSYQWLHDNTLTAPQASGLNSGNYQVWVEDQFNCRDTLDIFLPDPLPLSLVAEAEDAKCVNTNTGSLKVIPAGGSAPYDITWSNGAKGSKAYDLFAGTYSVEISDKNACVLDSTFTLEEPTPILLQTSKVDNACFGGSTGRAAVLASGGIAPYQYTWSNQEINSQIEGLSAGEYSVEVRDANLCVEQASVTVGEGNPIHIELLSQVPSYCGFPNGSARVLAQGGDGNLSYQWNTTPVQTGAIANNLSGTGQGISYWVEARDGLGCTDSLSVSIESLPKPEANFITIPNIDQPILRSEAEIKFINQSQNSDGYLWDFGTQNAVSNETHPTYAYTAEGTYRITLIAIDLPLDCPDTMYMDIVVIEDGKVFTANAFSPNDDGNNDVFYAYGEGIQSFEMLIFDRFGNLVKKCNHIGEGWDGKREGGKLASEGVYTFAIKALLNDGTRYERGGTITLFR